jgi:hypothetical protein
MTAGLQTIKGAVIDLGASALYGNQGNPVLDYAKQLNITSMEAGGSPACASAASLRSACQQGERVQAASRRRVRSSGWAGCHRLNSSPGACASHGGCPARTRSQGKARGSRRQACRRPAAPLIPCRPCLAGLADALEPPAAPPRPADKTANLFDGMREIAPKEQEMIIDAYLQFRKYVKECQAIKEAPDTPLSRVLEAFVQEFAVAPRYLPGGCSGWRAACVLTLAHGAEAAPGFPRPPGCCIGAQGDASPNCTPKPSPQSPHPKALTPNPSPQTPHPTPPHCPLQASTP